MANENSHPAAKQHFPWGLGVVLFCVALALLLLWRLSEVFLLAFGALLVATILQSMAASLNRFTRLPMRWGVVLSTIVIVAVVAGFVSFLGSQLSAQLGELYAKLPSMIDNLGDLLGIVDASSRLDELAKQNTGMVWNLVGIAPSAASLVANLVLVLVSGVFIAVELGMYRNGLLLLVPRDHKQRVADGIDQSGNALQLWLVGQLILMGIVGVAITTGLALLGMPSALGLGFIAAVLEFIPFFGPPVAAIPAILVAMTVDPVMALWVIGLYFVIQQIESNLLVPIVQERTVYLPPVLGLFSIFAFGGLFGPIGIVLGMPAAVVAMVFVKQFYLRDVLDEEVDIPGEDRAPAIDNEGGED